MIFLFNSSDFTQNECEDAYSEISFHFKDEEGRKLKKETLCGRLLLNYALSEEYSINEYTVISSGKGKPYLDAGGVFFNISHSGDYALCALGTGEIGCDVELLGEYKERIAKRFFTEKEARLLEKSENKSELFFRLWTAKESVLKRSGEGFSGGLSTYDFSDFIQEDSFSAYGLKFRMFGLGDAFACVCGENDRDLIKIKKINKKLFNLKGDTNENTKVS